VPAAVVFAGLVGATVPPTIGTLRASWSRAVEPALLPSVHALDSVVEEATFVAAPLVTAPYRLSEQRFEFAAQQQSFDTYLHTVDLVDARIEALERAIPGTALPARFDADEAS
jgi:hypothetical protein